MCINFFLRSHDLSRFLTYALLLGCLEVKFNGFYSAHASVLFSCLKITKISFRVSVKSFVWADPEDSDKDFKDKLHVFSGLVLRVQVLVIPGLDLTLGCGTLRDLISS